jgi:hypothetical protein
MMPGMSAAMNIIELPLFPLDLVLFPQGLLPLRIFEVRYLDMVKRCHQSSTPFGVVSLTQGSQVQQAGSAQERFNRVGTLARIIELDCPQPGLLHPTMKATQGPSAKPGPEGPASQGQEGPKCDDRCGATLTPTCVRPRPARGVSSVPETPRAAFLFAASSEAGVAAFGGRPWPRY